MAQQTINVGSAPNDGTGTPLRTAFQYTNSNFTELYTATGPSGNNIVVPGTATITGDLTVDTSTLKVDSTNDRVGLGIAAPAYRLHVQGTASLQLVLQSNDTNANAKEGTVNVRHYTNAEEPVSTVGGFTTSTANEVYLGGGFSAGNAATLLGFYTAANNTTTVGTERYRIGSDGTSTWSVGGSTAMTLNSVGLGVGVVGANGIKLSSFVTTDGAPATSGTTQSSGSLRIGAASTTGAMDMGTAGSYSWIQALDRGNLATNYDLVLQKNGGNVGIGVTPSYKLHVAGRISYTGTIGEGADATLSSSGTALLHGNAAAWTSQTFYTGGTSRVVVKQNGQVRFVPLAADPASPEAGDVYYNSSSNKLKCYNGTTWNDLF